MRVGPKIALVGGVPILAAGAIAVAGWLLLAQAERARGGAVLAAEVHHALATARLVRDQYVLAQAPDRVSFAGRFTDLTARAEADLERLGPLARTDGQRARIATAREALGRYGAQMAGFIRITRSNDGLVSEMAQRADTLIDLTDRARLRQQASNVDLARSLREKAAALRTTREVVAALNAVRLRAAERALEAARAAAGTDAPSATSATSATSARTVNPAQLAQARFRDAARTLAGVLGSDGRAADAAAFAALAARDDARPGEAAAELDAWIERRLKIDTSGQQAQHDEVAQLLAYAVEANEVEQATQNIAIATLKLGQRTAAALARRDPETAAAMLAEGERLGARAAALPISPLIQSEMVQAIEGWRGRLATTIGGLHRQNETIAAMDRFADAVSESARALADAFVGDADRFGTFIQQILLVGAAGLLLIGFLVAVFVARSILVPLRSLQGDMLALAADPGGSAVRETARRDELGDIARATTYFVSEINRREGALRRAKTKADTALLDLRRAQADLVRAEKLASLGQLVAGVAHEINTPLGIALTTGTLVRDEAQAFRAGLADGALSRSRLVHFVDRVEEGADLLCANLARAVDLVHGFKQVAVDRVSDEVRTFTLAVWLDALLASLRPLLRRGGHTVERECPEDLVVHTNPGALAQVVTNLVTNAVVHGFRAGTPGRIVLRVREDEADAADAESRVLLEVRDDGCGITPEDLERIFDPFFTTARSTGSTGLGMHIVHNLVTAKLRGRIAVASEPGAGTTVRITFPARREAEAAPPEPAPAPGALGARPVA